MATINEILDTQEQKAEIASPSTPASNAAQAPENTATTSTGPVDKVTQGRMNIMPQGVDKPSGIKTLIAEKPVIPASNRKSLSYVQMYEMFADKPETPEERAKREKREKREAVLAAVGDGISALSNLYFTTQYAPNAYNPATGMSAKARERWDKLNAERKANKRAYYEGYLRASAMDDTKDRDNRNWRYQLERDKIANDRYEAKAAQEKERAELDAKLQRHQITAAEYKAEQARIAAQYAEGTEKLKQENLRAGVRQKNASAGASHARAVYYNNGGNSGRSKFPLVIGNKTEEYPTVQEYEKAVEAHAKRLGVPKYITIKSGTGRMAKTETKAKPIRQLAAEVEAKAAESTNEFSEYEVNDYDFSQYEKK